MKFLPTTTMSTWRPTWCPRWRLMLAAGGMLILLWATSGRSLPLLAGWLDVGGPPQKADAVVLLNGSPNSRPFVAAAVVHGGWAPKIIVNTVALHPSEASGAVPRFFDITMKVLDYGGVPPDRVVRLDTAAATTFDEAQAVAGYLADHPIKRLLIVTDGPHTRRSRWIFQRMLADQPVEIEMVSAPTDGFDSENWWRSEDGFLFVVSEYFKFFYYGLRYGHLGYEIAAAAILAIFLFAWFLRRRKLVRNGAA
jgi:uncharacterized SAM-binding protein YcdF (DUF218 family)